MKNLSTDPQYLHKSVWAVISMANTFSDKLLHTGRVTLAIQILRLYVRAKTSSVNLATLATFIDEQLDSTLKINVQK